MEMEDMDGRNALIACDSMCTILGTCGVSASLLLCGLKSDRTRDLGDVRAS